MFRDGANLDDKPIALLTDRGKQYTIKFETTFVAGHDNDAVRVSIDRVEKMRGGSWEHSVRGRRSTRPRPTASCGV